MAPNSSYKVSDANKPSSACKLFFNQLTALLWKGFITRRRHYISTFFELIGPLLLPISIVLSNSNTSIKPGDSFQEYSGPLVCPGPDMFIKFDESNFSTDSPIESKSWSHTARNKLTVIYAPDNEETNLLVASLKIANFAVIAVKDEHDLRQKLSGRANGTDDTFVGISFGSIDFDKGHLSYTVLLANCSQTFTNAIENKFPVKVSQSPSEFNFQDYLGFVQVASHVNLDYVKECCRAPRCTNNSTDNDSIKFDSLKEIKIHRMPYPRYRTPKMSDMFSVFDLTGALITLGYVVLVPLMVKRIVDEKSGKVKELLRLIGMSDFVFWCAHFLNYYIILIVQAFLFTFLFYYTSYRPFFNFTSVSVFLSFFLVYGAQLVLFAMFISTFFNYSPVTSVIVTVIVWFILTIAICVTLVLSVCHCDIDANNLSRRLSSLVPSGSMLWLFSIIGDLENKDMGLLWSNIGSDISVYKDFTVLDVILFMIASCFLYAFLIFYLDNVWPFQHGVPKSTFFLFKRSYWNAQACETIKRNASGLDPKIYEAEPDNLAARIQIQDVCKTFKGKTAVDHLWLNIYENQLTVLLGHNGAGKTTTMNMITGMFRSTSGIIYVNSFNVFAQTKEARRSIGLCPQENIYFNELTVGQHLTLFAQLKDYPKHLINKEVNYVLDLLALQSKKNALAYSLSGGMKRKLALGIALVGNTETLILDEPTSGMDPEARRIIWDLLITLRRHRTILLTTHYMEEADVLGDRIAIMNEGKLCCFGSPLFLKSAYGAGYRLRVAKLDGFNSATFESVLKGFIPQAKFISEVETEVVYSLDGEKTFLMATFSKLFTEIEQHKAKYCIESCGLSCTSLEDVFLTVGSNSDLKQKPVENDVSSAEPLLLSTQSELLTGCALLLSQMKGLFLKRFHFSRRYWQMFLFQVIVPGLIIALAMYFDRKIHNVANISNMVTLDVEKIYGPDTVTFYEGSSKYLSHFKAVNEKCHANVSNIPGSTPDSINQWLLGRANSSLNDYIKHYLYGLQVEDNVFEAWFNNEQFLSLPLSIVNLFETLLHYVLPENVASEAFINVTINPIMSNEDSTKLNMGIIFLSYFTTCLVFMPLAFPFLGASYIMFPVKEQMSKSKLIQLITGLSPVTFWMMNFLFDMLTHLIATGILFLVIGLFDTGLFGNNDQSTGGALFMLMFAYGIATIPLAYALSYCFSSAASGFVFITIGSIVFGFIFNMIFSTANLAQVLSGTSEGFLKHFTQIGIPIVRLVPIFSFLFGYQKVYFLNSLAKVCPSISQSVCDMFANMKKEDRAKGGFVVACCPDVCDDFCLHKQNAFKMGSAGAGTELISLFLLGFIIMLGIVLCEVFKLKMMKMCACFNRSAGSATKQQSGLALAMDSDVEMERIRIGQEVVSTANLTDLLTVHKLSKSFGALTAVDDLSFGVRKNECFGFLGVNGAGKTTTFSILTGDIVASSGNAYINHISLMEDMANFRKHLGYCPQFDALLDRLSGDETLYLFARLRGVSSKNMKRDIDNLVQMVSLEEHRYKLTETYSGGTKRKLSIAVSLIGCPSLIMLDEPSAGVDPAARRKMWQTLGYIKRNLKSSVMLTSHSMEECEALCSRIAIMVNGKFQCLGATQHLRTKYGQGYSVTIRLKREHDKDKDTSYLENVQRQVVVRIPSAVLKDYHQCLMHYHVTDTKETWARIFTELSLLNEQFHFEDYFVADTTLEQIFITFARSQQQQST